MTSNFDLLGLDLNEKPFSPQIVYVINWFYNFLLLVVEWFKHVFASSWCCLIWWVHLHRVYWSLNQSFNNNNYRYFCWWVLLKHQPPPTPHTKRHALHNFHFVIFLDRFAWLKICIWGLFISTALAVKGSSNAPTNYVILSVESMATVTTSHLMIRGLTSVASVNIHSSR